MGFDVGLWMFLRLQWRCSAFRVMAVALVLAVAAMSSVGIFSARIEAALSRDVRDLLAADAVLKTPQNPEQWPWWGAQPQGVAVDGLRTSRGVVFPSMVSTGREQLLVSLKAVDTGYPLRGRLRVVGPDGQERWVNHGPAPGEAWVEAGVLDALGLRLGQTLQVGLLTLRVGQLVLVEPDRGGGFVQFAPRVLMHFNDLDRTQLLGPGARATWRFYMASDNPAVWQQHRQALVDAARSAGQILEWETLETGRPEVFGALQRAKDFLLLAALVGSLVACVGMALAAFVYGNQQTRSLVVLKSLGYGPKLLAWRLSLALLSLAVVGGLLGLLLGVLGHGLLLWAVAGLLKFSLPWAGWSYGPLSLAVAVVLVFGFAAWPLFLALRQPVVAVLRPHKSLLTWRVLWPMALCGVLAAFVVAASVLRSPSMAAVLLLGFASVCVLFAGLFWFVLKGLLLAATRGLAQGLGAQWSFLPMAWRSMARRPWLVIAQGVALCLGLTALMVLTLVQGDLLSRWQASIPSDAPNRFVFNIQPFQKEAVAAALRSHAPKPVSLYPMVRGRLTHIQGQAVRPASFSNPRSQRLLEREFNLSFTDTLPPNNTLHSGTWFNTAKPAESAQSSKLAEVSVEEGLAKQLGLGLGDALRFDVAGSPVEARITSVRSLRWDSMQVNFYVIFPTQVLQNFPHTWIGAVYLPPEHAASLSKDLLRTFPNVTVLDTQALVAQLRGIVNQVGLAVQSVFVFTVLAGLLVVWVGGLVTAQARQRETAIYRALGASRRHMVGAALVELMMVGVVAGVLSALCSTAIIWGLANTVLQLEYAFSWLWLLWGAVLGGGLSVVAGVWLALRVSFAPVVASLRASALA